VLITPSNGDLINGWIGDLSQVWQLCYRRSRDGASSSTFHGLCDGRGPSVTVLSNNLGRLLGGYASQSWNSYGSYYGDANSFLFSLTNGFRHTAGALYNCCYLTGYGPYGPTWGGGHDLHINGAMTSGYCNLGLSYQCRVGTYGSSTCQDDLCGSYSSWMVTELEVWVH
jgi:hypothetical protein